MRPGIGTNADGLLWDAAGIPANVLQAMSSNGVGWQLEVRIDMTAEWGGLANPFGLMIEAGFEQVGSAEWPVDSVPDQPATWEAITNDGC